jgi:hypothetical protein
MTQYRRRWSNALPWSVVGAGAAIAVVGGILQSQAIGKLKSYDSGVSTCSMGSPTGGCMPSSALASQKSSGEAMQAAAIAFYAIGGAAIVTGAVLVYLNRARPHRVDADRLTWTPVVGPSGGALVATLHF